MIVYTRTKDDCTPRHICPGDVFILKHDDTTLSSVEFTEHLTVDWYGIMLFCDDDGNYMNAFAGYFADTSKQIPTELLDATYINDLTKQQVMNLIYSAPFNKLGLNIRK